MSEQLELLPQDELQSNGNVKLPKKEVIQDAEWCFQFFDNEPIVFGWQAENTPPTPLSLQIQPFEGEELRFRQSGMEFKIFARPITEETKKLRIEQKENENDI